MFAFPELQVLDLEGGPVRTRWRPSRRRRTGVHRIALPLVLMSVR